MAAKLDQDKEDVSLTQLKQFAEFSERMSKHVDRDSSGTPTHVASVFVMKELQAKLKTQCIRAASASSAQLSQLLRTTVELVGKLDIVYSLVDKSTEEMQKALASIETTAFKDKCSELIQWIKHCEAFITSIDSGAFHRA